VNDLLASQPATLPAFIAHAATAHPDRGITILNGRGRNPDRRTYAQLHDLATTNAARFATLGISRQDPVLVALPTSWDWLEAWFGVLLAGGWPVAMAGAGAMGAAEAQLDKMDQVVDRIGARRVVATPGLVESGRTAGARWVEMAMTPDELRAITPGREAPPPQCEPDDVAFLQLTSGSTGLPRAVMITHRGAIHNNLASAEAIGEPHGGPAYTWADSMVAWLPLYHDMGLIGCLMLPIMTGIDTVLMRPTTFLARPGLWLEQHGRNGVTYGPAPNFGYQLCVERIRPERLAGLDLSTWRSAQTGAEMVRPETARAFCEAFEPFGFEPRRFQPCYGLAEGTLAVTFDLRGEGVRTIPAPATADIGFGLSELVSNGVPIRDTSVRIVAPDGTELGEDDIGEVCIKGPGVFAGYYRDPEATAESLRDGWFSTGDLGLLHGGELYLTGRIKDLLIVRGVNLMPDELERIADSVTGGGGLMRSAAFSVARGAAGEEPVLVVEVADRDPDRLPALEDEIKVRIGRALSLPLADVAFVRRGRIPRTTSGKMQRQEVRRRYLEGTLERIEPDAD
jgi:fatty-acyl-CoA synthase